jgi:hypothetical protein
MKFCGGAERKRHGAGERGVDLEPVGSNDLDMAYPTPCAAAVSGCIFLGYCIGHFDMFSVREPTEYAVEYAPNQGKRACLFDP